MLYQGFLKDLGSDDKDLEWATLLLAGNMKNS